MASFLQVKLKSLIAMTRKLIIINLCINNKCDDKKTDQPHKQMHFLFFIMNPFVLSIFLILTAMFRTTLAATSSNILPGSTLYASDPNSKWDSPDKTFCMSFIAYPQGTSVNRFAAITYDNHPSIPIWVAGANTITGGVVDESATLSLLPNGNLELRNGSYNSLVWQSFTAGGSISFATLEDTGNLILRNTTGFTIWSSFKNPTDTIVPTQIFTNQHILRNGMYSFNLSSDGNLNLFWNDTILYYNSMLRFSSGGVANISSPSISLLPNGILVLDDVSLSSPLNLVYNSDYDENEDKRLRFIKLDSDGNFRIYSFIRGSGSKNVTWSAVTDQCRVFGYCGNMGICSYNATISRPICSCPSENFELVDPTDGTKGCKGKVEVSSCPSNKTMLPLYNTQLLTYPPKLSNQSYGISISACRSDCLINDACVASTSLSDGSSFCNYQLLGDFVSGYQSLILPSTSYIKVCQPILPKLSAEIKRGKSREAQVWLLVMVILVTIFPFVLLKCILWFWCFRNSPKFQRRSSQYAPVLDYTSDMPIRFSYRELQRATKGFQEKLGVGGFGNVYKGILMNGNLAAVKMLEGTNEGEKQFMMKIATIISTHHLNLVRLIGFCHEKGYRFLVYEFMRNGSLDKFIFSSEAQIMNWECRYNVALGAARGIAYLHEECPNCIQHHDIKPENILLDDKYNPKVSDFGIAGFMQQQHYDTSYDQTLITSLKGTRGYMAPEWLANLPTTSKSDVYSYGLVLLEIVSGRRNFEVSEETNNKKFSTWAYEQFEKGNAKEILDKSLLVYDDADLERPLRAIQVSFWCIQEQPSRRPMMSKVVQMLEGVIETHKPPNPTTISLDSLNSSGVSSNVSATGSSPQFSFSRRSLPVSLSLSRSQTRGSSSSVSRKNHESHTSALLCSEITPIEQ